MGMAGRIIILCAAALLAAGCATWTFEPERTQKFVDEEGRYATVDYGREKEERTSVFRLSNGMELPFKSKLKVRVELPDGERFVAYRRMSEAGNLYATDDGEWQYFEQATACLAAKLAEDGRGYAVRYQGTLCARVRNPLEETKRPARPGGSTPRGFGRDSSGPRTVGE